MFTANICKSKTQRNEHTFWQAREENDGLVGRQSSGGRIGRVGRRATVRHEVECVQIGDMGEGKGSCKPQK